MIRVAPKLAIGLVLAFSASVKLSHPATATAIMETYFADAAFVIVMATAGVELLLASVLLAGIATRIASATAFLLFTGFAVIHIVNADLAPDSPAVCGCMGSAPAFRSWGVYEWTAFNSAMAVLGLAVFATARADRLPPVTQAGGASCDAH